jgi:hypothetical protein
MLIKLRANIPEIVVGVLLAVAVFAMGMAIESSRHPPSQQIESSSHPKPANETLERTAEKEIAQYTKWLAWFTGALVVVSAIQGFFLLRADKTARIAANAATRSSNAAIGMELPILDVASLSIDMLSVTPGTDLTGAYGGVVNEGVPGLNSVISAIPIENFGRTPAFPTKIEIGHCVASALPAQPIYPTSLPRRRDAFIDRKTKGGVEIHYGIDLTADQIASIRERTSFLWLYCAYHYLDFLREPHEARFCWKWSQDPPGHGIYGFISDSGIPDAYTQHS